MATAGYVLLGSFGVIALVAIIWRVASRGRSVPCPASLSWLVELDSPFTKTNRAAVIVERLDLQAGMAVLDVGCGPGRLTIPLARKVGPQGEVVPMDMQGRMLQRAQQKARAANLTNIRFLQAGAGEGKLGRDRFDRALLVTVLGEIPNRQTALREIFDALKSGGILSVTAALPVSPNGRTTGLLSRLSRERLPREADRIHIQLRENRELTVPARLLRCARCR